MIRKERRDGRETSGDEERKREDRERAKRERDKRELRRQFEEEEEGLREIKKYNFTWSSNTRKSQVHFMTKFV